MAIYYYNHSGSGHLGWARAYKHTLFSFAMFELSYDLIFELEVITFFFASFTSVEHDYQVPAIVFTVWNVNFKN